MKTITSLIVLLVCASAQAATLKALIRHKDYETALKHPNQIRFSMQSTKLGLLASEFVGVVKQFDASCEQEGEILHHGKITFKASQMDTDLGARNRKMLDLCLDNVKFPEITVDFSTSTLRTDGTPRKVKGQISIRGKRYPIEATLSATPGKQGVTIHGNSAVELSALGIPDPSIAVAKVRDRVDLSFQVTLN